MENKEFTYRERPLNGILDVSIKHHRLSGWSWLVYICLRFARRLAGKCLWRLRRCFILEYHLRLRFHSGRAGAGLACCFSSVSALLQSRVTIG